MIGVLVKNEERKAAREFFELFKTPWEFYSSGRNYRIILSTQFIIHEMNPELLLFFISEENQAYNLREIVIGRKLKEKTVEYSEGKIPVYGDLLTFRGEGEPIMRVDGEIVGLKIIRGSCPKIILGYDLFHEVNHLLSVGQPLEHALLPTLELHISLIRNLILDAGVPFLEIPPAPEGYDFSACLTHDIDFAGIRKHKFDHTLLGFLYRATAGSLVRIFKGKISGRGLLKNWAAVLKLPFVYMGSAKDFWLQFDVYTEIEKKLKSTFFLIPFKNRQGDRISNNRSERRAAKYDISDVEEIARTLTENGFEVAVHGIDAWHDSEKGRQERERIIETLNGKEVGVRIHWLLFNGDSYRKLEEAGYSYDSTCGYNNAIGYRAGALQVFKPFGTKRLLELPLHIQDMALLNPGRMNLSHTTALNLCEKLIGDARSYKGVLTILWHDRSLAPERLWGDFYLALLNKIRESKVWFATAGEIVGWFRKRRDVIFEKVDIDNDKIRLSLRYNSDGSGQTKEPFVFVRIYHPKLRKSNEQNPLLSDSGYMDIPLKGETSYEINLNP